MQSKSAFAVQKGMSALPPPKSGHVQRTSACPLWAKSGHHCGSSSVGKFFMPLGTAILDGRLLGDPGFVVKLAQIGGRSARYMSRIGVFCALHVTHDYPNATSHKL